MRKPKIEHKKAFTIKEVIFLIITTCVVSLTMGLSISLNNKVEKQEETTQDKYLSEFIDNYNLITDNYYENIDKSKLLSGAIEGMVSALGDTHSVTIDEDATSNFNIRLTGSYSGLGVEIVNDDSNNIVVYQVLDDSPAKKAGILAGDVIKSVDGTVYTTTKELSSYVTNSTKASFDIVILRNAENKTIKVNRDVVVLKSIYSEVMNKDDKKIGYIYISLFAENTADQFVAAVEALEKQNIDSLIIDVRDNSGGHLTSVVKMLSCLLDSKKVVYQIESKGEKTKYYSTGDKTKKYPIVVLQNSNSASASELLSATLKEQYKATIIGETSYGKGTVQELITLSNGTEYKFTTKKWLTPKGNWIDGVGVIPDIQVQLEQAYKDSPSNDTDNQLQTALNYLANL